MYTYFSRFLHRTLLHSATKQVSTPSLSLSDLIGESRSNQLANLFHLDHRVKPDGDTMRMDSATCRGRSMVEMLGVLAIIGVLSVGAIAGYSKAMFKYKLNKQAESFNSFVNMAIQFKPEVQRATAQGKTFETIFFYKAKLIPDGMTYKNGNIYDIFNNSTIIYSAIYPEGYTDYVSITTLHRSGKSITTRDREICRNMVTVAKENAADIARLELRSTTDSSYNETNLIGDNYTGYSRGKYLRNATINDIDDFCNSCDSEIACYFLVYY